MISRSPKGMAAESPLTGDALGMDTGGGGETCGFKMLDAGGSGLGTAGDTFTGGIGMTGGACMG